MTDTCNRCEERFKRIDERSRRIDAISRAIDEYVAKLSRDSDKRAYAEQYALWWYRKAKVVGQERWGIINMGCDH